jgi:DNA-binding NarL/FixJ family response regulator
MAKTVLIVDDNAYIRRALCELFTREAEFEVCGEAANGRQALSKVLELHPDLIVMDLSMPEMNGLETARELRRLMSGVPIILCTLFGDATIQQEAQRVGISEVVSKSQPSTVLIGKARDLLFRAS